MTELSGIFKTTLIDSGLITAFLAVGIVMAFSYAISKHITKGRIHGSAIAVIIGLILAYIGGIVTGGKNGLADIALFAGMSTMGGSMLRDFTIVATAFDAEISEIKKCGLSGVTSIVIGIVLSYTVGALVALLFGYTDVASITTIGAGTINFIVGPVTGTAVGASSEVIAISIAAGVVKSVAVMIATPFLAKAIGLDNPKSAMIFGGIMSTISGTAAGLAATDQKLVPYGAMTATFCTGMGCLLAPSALYYITSILL